MDHHRCDRLPIRRDLCHRACHLQRCPRSVFHLSRSELLIHAFYYFSILRHMSFHRAKHICQLLIFHLPRSHPDTHFHQQSLGSPVHASCHRSNDPRTWLHPARFRLHDLAIYLQTNHQYRLLHLRADIIHSRELYHSSILLHKYLHPRELIFLIH